MAFLGEKQYQVLVQTGLEIQKSKSISCNSYLFTSGFGSLQEKGLGAHGKNIKSS